MAATGTISSHGFRHDAGTDRRLLHPYKLLGDIRCQGMPRGTAWYAEADLRHPKGAMHPARAGKEGGFNRTWDVRQRRHTPSWKKR